MFWSGNYTANRELKFLLMEKNVTLTQVLEADDILQECKADYQTLSQFLSRPDILSELITLITEEPPKNVELSLQYRHANIACEVLTSNLSLLRDQLSSNSVQMNRLCDFVNRETPLNPLLASYFSKTINMLLEQSRKTDWYLHHIVCLRVLDFFKSRRDFVPNLLRHISTSAICDIFRCFLQTVNNSNIILEWLDEYHFLDCLIHIICGTYDPEEVHAIVSDTEEKAINEPNEKLDSNHNSEPEETTGGVAVASDKDTETNGGGGEGVAREEREERARRTRGVAAANAAALLCDIALDCGLYPGYIYENPWKQLAQRLNGEECVRRVLQGCFTSPAGARRQAVVHACRLLLALLKLAPPAELAAGAEAEVAVAKYREVERAVAPHLPLLHRALLKDVDEEEPREASVQGACAEAAGRECAGAARVHVAALVARLALSDVDDVPTALISLGTAGVLIDLSFSCSHNNFLHAQLVAFVRNARNNVRFEEMYTTHLIEECNLLTRLMDAFEENDRGNRSVRAGYMGHVVLLLDELYDLPPVQPPVHLQERWTTFCEQRLKPLLLLHHAPLGGVYPHEDFQEVKFTATYNTLEDGEGYDTNNALINFMAQASQRFNENVWEEAPADEVVKVDSLDDGDAPDDDRLDQDAQTSHLSWEESGSSPGALSAGVQAEAPEVAGAAGGAGGAGCAESTEDAEGWAQFDTPFNKYPFWAASHDPESPTLSGALQNLRVSDDDKDALTILLAHKMLAFHNMAPEQEHNFETQEGDLYAQTHTDHEGQMHSTLVGEDQIAHDGQDHSGHSEENQSPQDDQTQTAEDGQNQNIINVQVQSAQDNQYQSGKEDQSQITHDGQNQSAKEDQNQIVKEDQNQGIQNVQIQGAQDDQHQIGKDDQSQSAKGNQNQSAKEDQDQSAHGSQRQSSKNYQNQSAIEDQIQSAKEDQNQSSQDALNQNAKDGQNKSAQEANSAYDSPSADAES